MRTLYFLFAVLFFISCKIQPDASRRNADGKKVYKLRLNPSRGAKYYYDVTNESSVRMEVSDRKIDQVNRSHTGVYYILDKDSAGNLLFELSYDKLHIYSKQDDVETELDAANAATTIDPVEKMLGALTSARIEATMSPTGEIRSVSGYKEMTSKIMEGLSGSDAGARDIVRTRLEQMVGNGLIKNNMNQLFKIFPDSAVHVGDRWKLSSQQSATLNLNALSIFTLRKIEDGVAHVDSQGDISSDSVKTSMQGYEVTTTLKGSQEGEYEMDVQTGMLLSARIKASVDGTLDMMGRQIPVTIGLKLDMKGQKLK